MVLKVSDEFGGSFTVYAKLADVAKVVEDYRFMGYTAVAA